jgi:hypothetical protein
MTSVFERRIRGFRLIEIVSLGCLIALVLGVYLAKTFAGRERQEIARIERQIRVEHASIRLLNAEVAHLEQPERLERLSETYLNLKPVEAQREAPAESLEEISRTRADKPETPTAAPAAAPGTAIVPAAAPAGAR